ncbi:MAG TPA: formylglycine-generating enzyme family protein, partial [Lentisphaerae bacterium]|nr:formylglycine-generating enzyme family protein [Lentisphaerota bacterium]
MNDDRRRTARHVGRQVIRTRLCDRERYIGDRDARFHLRQSLHRGPRRPRWIERPLAVNRHDRQNSADHGNYRESRNPFHVATSSYSFRQIFCHEAPLRKSPAKKSVVHSGMPTHSAAAASSGAQHCGQMTSRSDHRSMAFSSSRHEPRHCVGGPPVVLSTCVVLLERSPGRSGRPPQSKEIGYMKRFVFTVAAFGAFSSLSAQEIVITGIDYPGRIAWTNLPDTNALYRVEWASSLQGPWRFTFDGLGGAEFRNLPGWTNSRFEAEVPMAYRVTMITSTPPVGMVYIPGGTFAMGNHYPSEGFSYEVPVHTVTVSSFWMSRTEVTRAEWDRVLDWALNKSTNLYQFSNTNYFKSNGDMPVVERSWYDIAKWCNAKSEMEGREPAYWFPDGIFAFTYRTGEIATVEFWRDVDGYRMPTEAEWEYAARGGLSGKRFPCGDTISHIQANYTSSGTNDYDISPT